MVLISYLGNCNIFPAFTLHPTPSVCHNQCSVCVYKHIILPSLPILCLNPSLGMKYSEVEDQVPYHGPQDALQFGSTIFLSHHVPLSPCLSALQPSLHPVPHTGHASSHHRALAHTVASTWNILSLPFSTWLNPFIPLSAAQAHVHRKAFPETLT